MNDDLHARAMRVTPLASQTRSRAWPFVGTERYPRFASHAEGLYLYDLHGREYIDLAGANAAVPLGYRHPLVEQSVLSALTKGTSLSLPIEEDEIVSRLMVEAVPGAEMVRWVKTGSEAVQAACVTAQARTGRETIVKIKGNYHGWHGNLVRADLVSDVDVARLIVEQTAVAAVLWEPPRFEFVDIVGLQALRAACTQRGTALVSDEVVWGCRWATDGSRSITGVRPDIACFSKALGNGHPVACIVGPADWIEPCWAVVSSTYGGERVGLAAARAVLELHKSDPVCARLRQIGQTLREAIDAGLEGSHMCRVGVWDVHFRFGDVEHDCARFDRFLDRCLDHGVLVHRSANNVCLPMLGHEQDIAERIAMAAHGHGR